MAEEFASEAAGPKGESIHALVTTQNDDTEHADTSNPDQFFAFIDKNIVDTKPDYEHKNKFADLAQSDEDPEEVSVLESLCAVAHKVEMGNIRPSHRAF